MTYQQVLDKAMAKRTGAGIRDQMYSALLDTHRWLYETYILKTEIFRIALVVGQYEYALDPTVKRVRTVNYVFAAGSQTILKAGSTKDWDIQRGDWRLLPNQIPREFSVEEGKLSLNAPAPTVSVGSGTSMYPRLEITAATRPLTLTLTDDIPWDIPESVYIVGTMYHWALDHSPEEVVGTIQNRKQVAPLLAQRWREQIVHLNSVFPKAAHAYRPQIEPEQYGVDVI